MNLVENLRALQKEIPENSVLVAVSKTYPAENIKTLYKEATHKDFGENRVQELIEKQEILPKDIRWHLIGNLQRNKVKYIAPFVYLIHSVDNLKLLKEINKQAQKNNRTIDCLLQIKIAEEDSKFGMSESEAKDILENHLENFPHVKIKGLMGMATFTDDEAQIRSEFRKLKTIFDELNSFHNLSILSMGMSLDFKIAIEEGSNMLRIGSSIFGARN